MARIAIVGAGLAGTFVAAAIVREATTPVHVDLIDERGTWGPGLAYGTTDEQHLLNVPAARVSARSSEPEHFIEYARTIDDGVQPGDFVPRAWYGAYLREVLEETIASAAAVGSRVRRVHDTVAAVRAGQAAGRGRVERIEFERDGRRDVETRIYDDVVLALGNLPGAAVVALPDDARAFRSPWEPGALAPTGPGGSHVERVLLIGTALTAVDAALTLAVGHERVRIVAASRSGTLPFAHAEGPLRTPVPAPDWAGEPTELDDLVERFCAHLDAVEADGGDWRDAVDGIRARVPAIWTSLGEAGQVRFLRERARDWELRRHRMAPRIAARLDQLAYDGRFEVRSGGVHDIVVERNQLVATLEGPGGLPVREAFDRIIDCTGAATDITRSTNCLVKQLLEDGRVLPDVHRRGIRTDGSGTVLDAGGTASPQLHTLGVLRRGELWETTGIGEIRAQADALGARLAAAAADRSALVIP